MNNNMYVRILPQQAEYFLKDDGTFDMDKALLLSGKYAGICYNKEGFSALENEDEAKTMKRVKGTLEGGHHSVFDHVYITFNFVNIPKILAMVLNNEHEYTTSEKSARYTPIINKENSVITDEEEFLYQKWVEIFKIEIASKYGEIFSKSKIEKLAQENARYLVTVFMPTQMVYTTSLRQINYIASFMNRYMEEATIDDDFKMRLAFSMKEFVDCLDSLGVLHKDLMKNEKNRSVSLFGKDIGKKEEYFGDVYSTHYLASFAEYAQAQRHRTLDYQLEMVSHPSYFLPPILENNFLLTRAWYEDMMMVSSVYPQGEMVMVSESGKMDDFILKCKERLCSHAQLEIANQEKNTLLKYRSELAKRGSPLAKKLDAYNHGARCTFPDYECHQDCKFKEGKMLVRKI